MERNKKKWKKIACLALTAALSFGLTNTDLLIARAEEIKDELTIIDDTGQDLEIITDEEELQEEEIVFEDEESPAVDTPVVDDNQTGIQDNNKTDTSTEQDKTGTSIIDNTTNSDSTGVNNADSQSPSSDNQVNDNTEGSIKTEDAVKNESDNLPAEHTHNLHYQINEDGTHIEICNDETCEYLNVEKHTYDENNLCVCGDILKTEEIFNPETEESVQTPEMTPNDDANINDQITREEEFNFTEQEYLQMQETINALKSQINTLENKKASVSTPAANNQTANNSKISSLSSQVSSLQSSNNTLRNNVNTLSSSNTALTRQNSALTTDIASLKKQINTLNTKLTTMQNTTGVNTTGNVGANAKSFVLNNEETLNVTTTSASETQLGKPSGHGASVGYVTSVVNDTYYDTVPMIDSMESEYIEFETEVFSDITEDGSYETFNGISDSGVKYEETPKMDTEKVVVNMDKNYGSPAKEPGNYGSILVRNKNMAKNTVIISSTVAAVAFMALIGMYIFGVKSGFFNCKFLKSKKDNFEFTDEELENLNII